MNFNHFHNALRVLRSIDRHEFDEVEYSLTDNEWQRFRDNPYHFFIQAPDALAKGIFGIIESRSKPDPAVDVLRRLLDDYDEERGVIDAHPDGRCIECCSIRPNHYTNEICPLHAAEAIVKEAARAALAKAGGDE